MCDKLVFDLAQEVEGSPSVFVRKDWINILDNQTQNYTSNQSVLDTSQLSNSNKYMSYRESYFLIPFNVTMATQSGAVLAQALPAGITNDSLINALPALTPAVPTSSVDSALGLKNWFGNIIHSFTLDYNGSTIIQQTPFVNMWNSFKLMTSLSYSDVITQGCTIGFYPDDAESFAYYNPASPAVVGVLNPTQAYIPSLVTSDQPFFLPVAVIEGNGVVNNSNKLEPNSITLNNNFQSYKSACGNKGFTERCKWINYDADATTGGNVISYRFADDVALNEIVYNINPANENSAGSLYSSLLSAGNCLSLWKSYIARKQAQVYTAGACATQTTAGVLQYSIVATVYLKHLHSFFNMCPLLKGVFMKMTMNLNNCASTVVIGGNVDSAIAVPANSYQTFTGSYSVCTQSSSALGGVNMLMMASQKNSQGASNLNPQNIKALGAPIAVNTPVSLAKYYRISLSVGGRCLDATTAGLPNVGNLDVGQCKSIYLYIPAYTFNPPFEQAYISSPVKSIKYTDIYQYQVLGVDGGQAGGAGGQFNNLLTNGIANIKSVLILPFFSPQNDTNTPLALVPNINGGAGNGANCGLNTGFASGLPVWQSPYDPAGTGATSPLCHFTNFNVQVSGQNAIYNLQLRGFEQFNNQLYGQNAVNGGLTDGITSSLVDRQQFDLEYCYYYVNVERMLPVEQSVPKSVQILGTNLSGKKVDLMCFIEYGTEVSIDVLTGARV